MLTKNLEATKTLTDCEKRVLSLEELEEQTASLLPDRELLAVANPQLICILPILITLICI